ncbi:hypothetical protein DYU11_11490 [Fibrisoma montanum]|uniref:Phage tail tape measure protein n=1 Tax=Fibrisoma montanum TaxID=2305895 RepID=A0A418MB41_9BACT|nr:hypothetical protein [Fibrisoma montanum]RIV23597.1 hypothetical protein DYU11_11490 [Fibrisoma montanum]
MTQEITSKYNLDISDLLANLEKAGSELASFDDRLQSLSQKNPIANFTKQQQGYNQALGQQVRVYQQIEATQESFRREVARLENEYEALNKRRNEFIAAGRYQELQRDLTATRNRINEIKTALGEASDGVEKVKKSTSGAGDIFSKLKDYVIGAFAVDRILAAGTAIVNTTGKFEKYEAVLTNALGSRSVAQENLRLIADYAANSPSQVDEVTEAFVKLANRGLVPTKEQLINIGDLAASQGKGIDQLTEAILDAQSGEFERLKEFGIRASKSGDQVTLAFKGTSQTVKATSEDITEAILKFGQLNGVAGSTAAVSKTLEGQMSNFSDQVDRLSVGLGNSGLGGAFRVALQVGGEFLGLLTDLVTNSPAEDLRKQQLELNGLVGAIALANDNEQVRLSLIQQLNQKYPEFLGKLNAEAVTTDLLAERLRVVNGLYEQKIRIALGQEKIKKVQDELTASIAGQSKALQDLALASGKSVVELEKLSAADRLRLARDFASGRRRISPQAQEQNLNASYFEITVDILERRGKQQIDLQKQLATLSGENAIREVRLTQVTVKGYQDQIKQVREKIRLKQLDKKLGEEEIKRLEGEIRRAEGKPAVVAPTPTTGPTSEEKKAAKARLKAYQDEQRELLGAQEEYVKEYEKLQEQFGKDKLESLKKDGEAYILEKARLDKAEVDAERVKFEKLLQLAASNKTRINPLTGKREVVADQSVSLEKNAPDIARQFEQRRNAVDVEADRQIRVRRIREERELLNTLRGTAEQELALFDNKWAEILASEEQNAGKYAEMYNQYQNARLDYVKLGNSEELAAFDEKWEKLLAAEEKNAGKYAALVKQQARERRDLVFDQIIRGQRDIESIAISNIQLRRKGDDQTGTQFAKRNELDTLDAQIYSGESQISALEGQANIANTPEIKRLEAYVKALKDKRKEIELLSPANRDIWDLLGISKSFKDETERELFLQAVDQVSRVVQETTQLIIQASEERIRLLDQQIQAKEEQVRVEEERDREGAANNLKLRRAELEDLKRQKAEEEAVRRKALATQQVLDLAAQVSNNAVTVSNTVVAITEMFKTYGKIPFVGIILALGAIATIIGTIASVKARAKAITQLREGGRIPLSGRTHERGGHRIDGTDIEVERGEWVTNAKSSEKYHEVLDALNEDDPRRAFAALMARGFGLPDVVTKQLATATTPAGYDFSRLEGRIDGMSRELAEIKRNTKPGKQIVPLANGKILVIDGNHTSLQDPPRV